MKAGNRFLIVGIALIVLSAVLTVSLSTLGYALIDANSPEGQGFLVALELGVRVMENITAPLGAAMLAVGAMIVHLHRARPADPESGAE